MTFGGTEERGYPSSSAGPATSPLSIRQRFEDKQQSRQVRRVPALPNQTYQEEEQEEYSYEIPGGMTDEFLSQNFVPASFMERPAEEGSADEAFRHSGVQVIGMEPGSEVSQLELDEVHVVGASYHQMGVVDGYEHVFKTYTRGEEGDFMSPEDRNSYMQSRGQFLTSTMEGGVLRASRHNNNGVDAGNMLLHHKPKFSPDEPTAERTSISAEQAKRKVSAQAGFRYDAA